MRRRTLTRLSAWTRSTLNGSLAVTSSMRRSRSSGRSRGSAQHQEAGAVVDAGDLVVLLAPQALLAKGFDGRHVARDLLDVT
jgi:hypothetical protein